MRVRVILSTTADKFLQKIQELQKIISRVLQVQTPFCTIFSQSLNYKRVIKVTKKMYQLHHQK
jgi:hypothetical protein